MPGKCKFNFEWCKDKTMPEIAKWLKPVQDDPRQAMCSFCSSKFDIRNSGITCVRKHSKGKSHISKIAVGLG